MTPPVHILCTGPLDNALVDLAGNAGIDVEILPLIETRPVINKALESQIGTLSHQPLTAVFTSRNAVDAVKANLYTERLPWKIFCMGMATLKRVTETFGEDPVIGTARSAAGLADVIIRKFSERSLREPSGEIYFFCGDQRREELPLALKNKGIGVNEIVVYTTHPISRRIGKEYDGIMFFSPSAVHSFFSVNSAPPPAVFFAIGETTAHAIGEHSRNRIVICGSPDKEVMIRDVIRTFEKN